MRSTGSQTSTARRIPSLTGTYSDWSRRVESIVMASILPPTSAPELDPVRLIAEVHEKVAGLLCGPFPGWVQCYSEDADPPGRVLDHGQDVGLGAVKQVGGEEIAGQDRPGLGAQELRPGRPGPPRCGVDAVGLEDLPYGRCRDLDSQAGQLAVDPAVSPSGVLPGQPEDQGLDVPAGRQAARPDSLGSG